jgi:protease-4
MSDAANGPHQIVIHNHPPRQWGVGRWFIRMVLILSIMINISLLLQARSYLSATNVVERFRDGDSTAPDKIAVISVNGMITSETIQSPKRELRHAAEDSAVKAVLLAVDSPGGTIAGSDELYHAIEEFRSRTERKKPIVVSMQGMGTSGAYYISMPADKIFASRTCITGSIGVIASMFEAEDLMKKIGVTSEVIKSGKMKDSGSPFRKMTTEDRAEWQKLINGMFEQFLGVILKNRKSLISEEKLRQLADGRVYLAEEALKYKLIDAIGFQEDAVAELKKMAQLPDRVRIVTYVRPLDSLLGLFMGESAPPPTRFDVSRMWELQTPKLLYMPGAVIGN